MRFDSCSGSNTESLTSEFSGDEVKDEHAHHFAGERFLELLVSGAFVYVVLSSRFVGEGEHKQVLSSAKWGG